MTKPMIPAKPKFRYEKRTTLFVPCPYCRVGHGIAEVRHADGADQLLDIDSPRQCNRCKALFKIMPRFEVVGVPFEQPAKPPTQGELIRSITGEG